jgi:two-component sensor histidine kinase
MPHRARHLTQDDDGQIVRIGCEAPASLMASWRPRGRRRPSRTKSRRDAAQGRNVRSDRCRAPASLSPEPAKAGSKKPSDRPGTCRLPNCWCSGISILTSNPTKPPIWSEANLRLAVEAAGVALWSWNVDSDELTMDERGYHLWGVPVSALVTFEDLSSHIHPADRDRVRAAFAATRAIAGPYEIDFRILIGESVHWVSARGQGEDVGMVGRVMFGIFIDVTGRKQAEEGNELLAGEMSHRVKNLLAIASGLTSITSRSTKTTEDMARQMIQRLTALGRAHDLVRPLPGEQGKAALLGDLIAVLLAPYDDMGAFSGRVRVSVPRMGVGEGTANILALVLHELATNSLKYGALSSATGTLDVSCSDLHDDVVMVWTERGGPDVQPPEGTGGYGSKMVSRVLANKLSGTIERNWSLEGAIITVTMNKERLAA